MRRNGVVGNTVVVTYDTVVVIWYVCVFVTVVSSMHAIHCVAADVVIMSGSIVVHVT